MEAYIKSIDNWIETCENPRNVSIKQKNPEKDLSPLQYKLWIALLKLGDKTTAELRNLPQFHQYSTIDRRLREIRETYVNRIDRRGKPPLWRAIPK